MMVISELVACAGRRTGIAGTPNKTSVVKNVNVPNFMMPSRFPLICGDVEQVPLYPIWFNRYGGIAVRRQRAWRGG